MELISIQLITYYSVLKSLRFRNRDSFPITRTMPQRKWQLIMLWVFFNAIDKKEMSIVDLEFFIIRLLKELIIHLKIG